MLCEHYRQKIKACGGLGVATSRVRYKRFLRDLLEDDTGEGMGQWLEDGCVFLAHVLNIIGPRRIQMLGIQLPSLTVYSDASFLPEY